MKPVFKALTAVTISAFLAACATGPRPINANKSLALNLAEAGDIDGLSDQKIPAEDYGRITGSNFLMDAGWTGAITASPAPGFSSGFGLGLGLLTMLFPKPVGAKHHQIVAWMPMEMVESPVDAQLKMRDITAKAIEAALNELKWDHGPVERATYPFLWGNKIQMVATLLYPEGSGCPTKETKTKHCILTAGILKPTTSKYSPEAIDSTTVHASFFFDGSDSGNGFIHAGNIDDSKINTPLLYATISKHLPDWAYFYTPPARYLRGKASDMDPQFPVIYYKGKAELFAVPEQPTSAPKLQKDPA